VHRGNLLELRQPVVGDLAAHQHFGQNANGVRAAGQRRIGHRAHQPDIGPAIDQSQPGCGNRRAQRASLGYECWIGSESRSAENGHAAKRLFGGCHGHFRITARSRFYSRPR
jgi:hypothetical protein